MTLNGFYLDDPGVADRRPRAGRGAVCPSATGTKRYDVALVTGASGGIGRAIALELLDRGTAVFMLGRSMARLAAPPPPESTRERCRFVVADLTDPSVLPRVAADIAEHGRLDLLVLSSGIYERSNEPSVFARQIATNLVGPYSLIRQLLPLLIEARGQIVFVNSTQGLKAAAGIGQYAATQHAMKAIADSLRDEVNASGVRVTSIFLGRTATERQRGIFAAEGRPYPPEQLIQPSDVAQVVASLQHLPRTSEVTDIVLRPAQKT